MDNKTTGFTLIEMLVGLAVGLIIVAAATVMMVSTLKSQKDITASAKLNQEIGAAMAVMSNEIRRAGFNVCNLDGVGFECPANDDGDEVPFLSYLPGEDLEIGDVDGEILVDINGDCILYRYNADVDGDGFDGDTDIVNDDDDGDLSEHRGFRLKDNIVQMALYSVNHDGVEIKCDDDLTVAEYKWVDLTDSDVIKVTELSFSTTGSKCRNMTLPDPNPDPEIVAQYWVVKDKISSDVQTGPACENGTVPIDYYTVTVDPTDPSLTVTNHILANTTVTTSSGDELFGVRQIRITLEAALTTDSAVTKRLESSIKVANPRIEKVP